MKEDKIKDLLTKGINGSHNSVAKLLMEKYKYIYKCASIDKKIWYEFRNHRWIKIDSAYTLRNIISDELFDQYRQLQDTLYEKVKLEKDENEKERLLGKTVTIGKLLPKLENASFKDGVIKECSYVAYDPHFLRNMDENPYLLCFTNGVYDLKAAHFRDGCPDDYISLCTNYDYIEFDRNDEYVKEVEAFMEKIMPDKELRDYLLTLAATTLSGSISEECFYVFTGSGANGKSKFMDALKHSLGDYFRPMDIKLLTQKRAASSAASPELADKKGIRACPLDEPEATDEINTGFMKYFTGGDVIQARALYSDQIYFKPQFKPFLLCNTLPGIRSDDDGTWRRLKVIHFGSKFWFPTDIKKYQKKQKAKGKSTKLPKDHFPADLKLTEKIPDWRQSFMSILIKYYNDVYMKKGLIHPRAVTKYTSAYRRRCDVYQDFINDWLEPTDNEEDNVSLAKLSEAMRSWHKTNYSGKPPSMKDLRDYMQRKMHDAYNSKKDALFGYKFKIGDNEESIDELAQMKK
jgi:P4 family phage/plasmid primase-like protien